MFTGSEVISYQGSQRRDPGFSGVGENSQSGTSFPEGGTSFEGEIKPHANGPPHRLQQVKASNMESGCALPEMSMSLTYLSRFLGKRSED